MVFKCFLKWFLNGLTIKKGQRVFRAVANREPDRSNARRNESTSDENIFPRKVRHTAARTESEAALRENSTN